MTDDKPIGDEGGAYEIPPPEPKPKAAPAKKKPSERELKRLRRYTEAALTRCADEVRTAVDRARNDGLNRQAFNLGKFVGAGVLDRSAVESALGDAARASGLPDSEIAETLASGVTAGIKEAPPIDELLERIKRNDSGPQVANVSDLPTDSDGRAILEVVAGQMPTTISDAVAALQERRSDEILLRGDVLVQVTPPPPSPLIASQASTTKARVLDKTSMADVCNQNIAFWRYDARSDCLKPIDCTDRIAATILSRGGNLPFGQLLGIVSAPTLREDGSIVGEEGYDAASGLFVSFGGVQFPEIQDQLTRGDAAAALAVIEKVYSEFPFVEASDRSAAIAASLTGVVRQSLRTAPLFATRATDRASGKSLLCDLFALICTGENAPARSQARNQDEERKQITATLLSCAQVSCIDNCERTLTSPELCTVLTQDLWSDRLLGFSKQVLLPTRILWLANGNNLSLGGDLPTRTVPCDIDPKVEHPGTRTFTIPDLRQYVRENRPSLVAAALTIMRAYVVAGSPKQVMPTFGRFEDWDARVRAPLIWLGLEDPCKGTQRLELAADSGGNLRAVLETWNACYGFDPVTTRDVVEAANESRDADRRMLREALVEVAADSTGALNSKKLGAWLGQHQGRIAGGLKVVAATMQRGLNRWSVVHV